MINMTNSIFFSILIPAYKAKFLRHAIDSILAQTYREFELIIVDDNSPEDLNSIVGTFDDSRIHYYRNDVGFGAVNVVGNWNKCFEYSSGDYVICMGDDDELSERCLEEYVMLIKKYPEFDCYHTRLAYIDDYSSIIDLQIDRAATDTVYSAIWHSWKGRGHVIGDWLFSSSFLKRNKGFVYFPCAWSSDSITAFVAATSHGIANTSYVGFRYRVSQCTISSNYKDYIYYKLQSWLDVEKWYKNFLTYKPDNDSDIFYWKYMCDNLDKEMRHSKRLELRNCFTNGKTAFWGILHSCNNYGIKKTVVVREFLHSVLLSICKLV